MGRWKRRVLAAIWMAALIVPGDIARASTTGLIAFASDRDHAFAGLDLYTMAADGTGVARLTTDATPSAYYSSPDWSYDGTQIAMIKNARVWVMNANGSNPTQLTTGTGAVADFHPSWSPDGTQIAYEHRTAAGSEVYVINANGTNPHPLTTSAPYDSTSPSWSPDGSKIAFASDRDAPNFVPQIYVMGSDGSNQVPLTSSTAAPGDSNPAWSPDGQKIAFVGTVITGQTNAAHIFVMNANGASPVQITNGAGNGEGPPTWSPDGTQIAFAASYPPMPNTFAPSQIYKVNSSGGTVTDLSNNSNQESSPAWQKNAVVDISAGQPVPEPATGSVPETFTITLPAAQQSDVTVHYKTLDGTATAAANAYTPIADASTTITAGQTSKQIQVQVDNGSGKATTATESFQVKLTSSSGSLPIGPTAATGVITIPGITGKLTDDSGAVEPSHALTITGTAASGQSVTQHLTTDGGGRYQLYADPGNYTVTPDSLGGKQTYEPIGCPGTVKTGACTKIALESGASLTIDFKLLLLVVNSTMDSENLDQAGLGICDVTPAQPAQTCTLRQALDVAYQLGGGTITFNISGGGVPVIRDSGPCLCVYAPTVIDGTTQPESHEVAVMGVGRVVGFTFGTSGSTLRGMTVNNFVNHDVALFGGDTLQQDRLGTLPSSQSPTEGIVQGLNNGGHNVIQGSTIGGPQAIAGSPVLLMGLEGAGDTIGGSLPGQGNTFTNGGVHVEGRGDVVQGNSFAGAVLIAGDNVTVGGPTPIPGTGAGNDISGATGAGLELQSSDVVQGNHLHGNDAAGIEVVRGDRNTIGGASPQMGNLVDGNGISSGGQLARAGIAIGEPNVLHESSYGGTGNVIEHNRIIDNPGDGGVAIYEGVGNQIVDNQMSANMLGINLGGGPFLYDNASHTGPNDYQPYPQVYGIASHGGLHITGRLNASPDRTYTIELYSQPSCAIDSVTPGQGLDYIGRRVLPVGSTFTLAFPGAPAGQHAVTVTATADDSSTSEFSTCLTIGHTARSFAKSGVTPTANTVTVTTTPAAPARDRAATSASARAKATAYGILQLLCPPITTGSCTGTLVLATTGRGATILGRKRFKLASGEGLTIKFAIPASVLKRLQRSHRLAAKATIIARDAAKHHNHKTTITRLTLRLAN